jgi:hypothetical protein
MVAEKSRCKEKQTKKLDKRDTIEIEFMRCVPSRPPLLRSMSELSSSSMKRKLTPH